MKCKHYPKVTKALVHGAICPVFMVSLYKSKLLLIYEGGGRMVMKIHTVRTDRHLQFLH